MFTEEKLAKMCAEVCNRLNIEFNVPVKINKRLTTTLGRVIYYSTPENEIIPDCIEFSYNFLMTSTEKSIKDVVEHECAHFLVTFITKEKHGHDAVFRSMCHRIGCTNDSSMYEDLERTVPDSEVYKYLVVCQKCGKIIAKYHRAGKIVKHPELYLCKCSGKLNVIQNF